MQTKVNFTKRAPLQGEKCQDCESVFLNAETVYDVKPLTRGEIARPVCFPCVLDRSEKGIDDHRPLAIIKRELERERLKREKDEKKGRITIKNSART